MSYKLNLKTLLKNNVIYILYNFINLKFTLS